MNKHLPFNQELRRQRKLRGWSQAVLAERIESDVKTVSRWELGKTLPSPFHRQKLIEVFSASTSALDEAKAATEDNPLAWWRKSVIGLMEQEIQQVNRARELCFGVIGWGYWGPKIARSLDSLPNVRVTTVIDTDARRLAPLAVSHPHIKTTTDIEQLLHSEVDGVVIATPIPSHYGLAKQALLSGKHVMVEKPMTASIAEAEELVALAREQENILMVGHTFEYNPAVNELRKLVQSGDLGKIYCVETERLNLGLFRNDTNVIWDLAPHDISILLYVFGEKPNQIKVQASSNLQAHVCDVAHLDLKFTSGMNAHIHVSWLHPSKIRRITVIGDTRMAVYDDINPSEMVKIYNKGAEIHADPYISYRYGAVTIPHVDWIEPLRLQCEDFVNAIRLGAQPRAHGEVGLDVVRILAAAQEALDRQEREQEINASSITSQVGLCSSP